MIRLVKFLVLSVVMLTFALASPPVGYSKVLKLGNVQPPTMIVQKGL